MPEVIRNLTNRYGMARSAAIVLVSVLTFAAIWGVSRWATAPEWLPLFPGLALESVGEVTSRLDEQGVRYRLAKGGAEILVPDDQLARARVLLAREGLPSAGRPGFELFDRPSWGMTDFTQRINYRRALEGELERTISGMRGIESAQVHLAINESSAFRRQQGAQAASVVLKLRSGMRPDAGLVDGIASLVSSAVDGLSSENVTVLDNAGHLLSAAVEPGMPDGLSARQLKLRREVEAYLEAKAEELVAQVVGAGNSRVRVAADVNFDRVDRTTQRVDPDQQITTREERTDIVPGPGQVGAGSTAMSAAYEASRTVETFSSAAGSIRRLTVAVLVNERQGESARVLSPDELQRVEALVANAVGLDVGRGDAISVLGIPFETMPVVEPPPAEPWIIMNVQPIARHLLGVLALIIAAFVALRAIRTLRPAPMPGYGAGMLPAAQTISVDAALHAAERRKAPAVPPPTVENAELAARVMKAWMRET